MTGVIQYMYRDISESKGESAMLISYLAMIGTEHEKTEFVRLYERYRNLMHYAAKQILGDDRLAEEAVQESFLRIAKNFSKVQDADQPAIRSFVLIITENAARTLRSSESKHNKDRVFPCDGEEPAGICTAWGNPTAAGAETREAVAHILEMPELQQSVLFLHAVYGFSYREIAGLLGVSESTARKRVERARRDLGTWMQR